MSKIDRRRLRACVGLPRAGGAEQRNIVGTYETKSQSESRGDAKTRRFGANGGSERLSAAPRLRVRPFGVWQEPRASFDRLRMRGNFGGTRKDPHAELVEARNARVQVSCRGRRLR